MWETLHSFYSKLALLSLAQTEEIVDRTVWESLQHYYSEFTLFRVGGTNVSVSHVVVALIMVIASGLVSKIICGLLKRRVFRKLEVDPGLEYAILRFLHFGIIAMGLYIGLTTISIDLNGLVAVFAILGVGIGFGLQNIASNFISGIILLLERPVKVGDRIEVGDLWGDVQRINLRTTVVNTPDNINIIIPNSVLLESNVTNYYYGDRRMRIHVAVGVAYGSDIDKVTAILLDVAEKEPTVLNDPEAQVRFMEFGDSSLNFELLCWIPGAATKNHVRNLLNREIDKGFRGAEVEIPFPQRDLHIRSVQARFPIIKEE